MPISIALLLAPHQAAHLVVGEHSKAIKAKYELNTVRCVQSRDSMYCEAFRCQICPFTAISTAKITAKLTRSARCAFCGVHCARHNKQLHLQMVTLRLGLWFALRVKLETDVCLLWFISFACKFNFAILLRDCFAFAALRRE